MTHKNLLAKAQKKWYLKLKKTGFVDIEQNEDTIKLSSTQFFYGTKNGVRYNEKMASYEGKLEYYRLAEHFLNDHEFKNEIEKKIWELHSEGKSYREISKTLRTEELILNKDNVQITITTIKEQMLKFYGIKK
jgi:hypothetical protein